MSDFIKKTLGFGAVFITGAIFGASFIHAYKQMNKELGDLDIIDYEDEEEKTTSPAADKSQIYSSTKTKNEMDSDKESE